MIIKNGKIFQKQGAFVEGSLYIKDDKIVENKGMISSEIADKESLDEEVIDATGLYVIPGLTDIHFHGCAGYDFCDGTYEAIAAMTQYQLKNGVTTICPASMTLPEEQLTKIFQTAAEYVEKYQKKCKHECEDKFEHKTDQKEDCIISVGAELIGINMEGPFVSLEKRGAQNKDYICQPDVDTFFRLQTAAKGLIKICDIAPETIGGLAFIKTVSDKVIVSLAHTCADYEIAMSAFNAGARHVTHLYNGMMPFSHRAPGVVGAACDNENVYVELIADGVHVHPSTVRTTFKLFGDDRIVLISDSVMATGLKDGDYKLGGQDITVKGDRATLTGTEIIAGSVTNLMNCVRMAVKEMGIPLESAVKCAAVNPAKAIGIYDKYGSLDVGKQANIVILDRDLEIRYVIKDGGL